MTDILKLQQRQHQHDIKYHADVAGLSRQDRLKHYALHMGKYAGRLAENWLQTARLQPNKSHSRTKTLADVALTTLACANALGVNLAETKQPWDSVADSKIFFIAASGMLCDAAEKTDHAEEYLEQAKNALVNIWHWVMDEAEAVQMNLTDLINTRRMELRQRAFWVQND